jgi:hypothetical protein
MAARFGLRSEPDLSQGRKTAMQLAKTKSKAKFPAVLIVAICVLFSAAIAHADAVTDWNAIMQTTVAPSNAFVQARSNAIVQLAVFEAVNAITGKYRPYLGIISAPSGASADAAAIAAAHRTLVTLYPGSTAALDTAEAVSLSAIPDGQPKTDGVALGEAAASAILALRANDGSALMVPYAPGTDPGDWQPTPPAFAPALLPGWGQVTTFGILSGAQFRSAPPPVLGSADYARYYNEVKLVGDVNSTVRPQDRTDVAHFYIIPAVQVYNPAARQVSAAQGKTLSQNAHDFALLGMAMCDGLISSMETKYFYNRWRPVTAIRAGDTDGNPKTEPDTAWLPLIATPPFPSYPSAHADAGGAARRILERVYGKDGFQVTLTSPTAPGVVLHYTAWKQITDDVDDARVFGGIHYRYDQQAGAQQGWQVGSFILETQLLPLSQD